MNTIISKGVSFDNIHSFDDLDLIFAGAEIPPATPKENYIDVPGADSSLDLTEALGEVKYNDRSGCKFTFTMNPEGDLSDEAFEEKKTEISNLLNGTVRKITLDKDPDYYYYGRCTVNGYAQDKKIKQFVISAKVKPYKYKQTETRVLVPLCGKNLIPYPYFGEFGKINGLNYTDAGEGAIAVKGTLTDAFSTFVLQIELPLIDGVTYYIGDSSKLIFAYKDETGVIKYIANKTITWSKKYTFLQLYLQYSSGAVVDEIIKPMMCIDNATDYEPYQTISPQNVILPNSRKTVVPIINCTSETTITFRGNDYSLNIGTHKILDLQLYKGDNPITVDGTGLVTFTYQEGEL